VPAGSAGERAARAAWGAVLISLLAIRRSSARDLAPVGRTLVAASLEPRRSLLPVKPRRRGAGYAPAALDAALEPLLSPAFRVGATATSWGELIGFATGVACVWLLARQERPATA
jgi:hypothetical protein